MHANVKHMSIGGCSERVIVHQDRTYNRINGFGKPTNPAITYMHC